MKRLGYAFAMILLAGLTVLAGTFHGRMSNRWGPSPDVQAAADRMQAIPEQFGDWQLQSTDALEATARNMLQCTGELVRKYQNQRSGDVVSVVLLLGPPGPISVHTPEICFGSRNYQSRGQRETISIPGVPDEDNEFWSLDFQLNNLRGDRLRVYYGWSSGTRWTAAKDARFAFAGRPYLYKMQLSAALPPKGAPPSDDPCFQFLQEFLPVAKQFLVEPPAS